MNTLFAFMVVGTFIGLITGLVMCLLRSKRQQGAVVSITSLVLLIVSMTGFGATTSDEAKQTTSDQTKQATAKVAYTTSARPPTKREMVEQFRIRALSWEKSGFGTIMIANFTIHNDNMIAVKDVKVQCSSWGPSGSIIDNNAKTIYESIQGLSYLEVTKLNMGFIRSETVDTKCKVVDFTPA